MPECEKKEFDNTNCGVLFRNNRKDRENDPDYRGELNVGGTEYWINAWLRTSKSGTTKFLSISVRGKKEGFKRKETVIKTNGSNEFDDAIPF